ncbi:MAG: glycosyl hydrolase, partial [Gammaproteobacteria bacterium]
GHGLTYTRFAYTGLKAVSKEGAVTASFDVKNVGALDGKEVAQVYVGPAAGGWEAPKRLAAWQKVDLKPGGSARVTVSLDPRLLATWSDTARGWRIGAGSYEVMVGASAQDIKATASVTLQARTLPEPPLER